MANTSTRALTAQVIEGIQTARNYISNSSAHVSTLGWATYADAAGALPVDGTGGSPNITFTRTTSTPLNGDASFLLTKDAANRQGQGASFDFTIDREDLGQPLTISGSYEIASGTYATGDLAVYIYDITNALVIQPAGFQIEAAVSPTQGKINATFQTAVNSSSYRLIVHVASTSASAYTVEFDRMSVGPQTRTIGAAMTDWQAYTPTFTGFGTPSAVQAQWRRVGDTLQIRGRFASGSSSAVEARISFPSGLTSVDSTSIPVIEQAGVSVLGGAFAGVFAMLREPSVTYFTIGVQDSGRAGLTKQNASSLLSSGNIMAFEASCPIAGWSSNTLVSSSTDTRVVAMRADKVSGSQTATGTEQDITAWDTVATDTHGAFNSSTGVYTVRVPGLYKISGSAAIESNTTGLRYAIVQRNNVTIAFSSGYNAYAQVPICVFSTLVNCVAGDTLKVRYYQDSGANRAFSPFAGLTVLNIERLSGPSQIAASEVVSARITGTATGTINGSTNNVYPTVQSDTHAAYNTSTGVYTIPVAGEYNISTSAGISFAPGSFTTTEILRNGTGIAFVQQPFPSAFTNTVSAPINVLGVRCNAGDTITVRYNANGSPTFAAGTFNWFTIARVGGVM